MSERVFVGHDVSSTGLWWRVDGEVRLEPAPDPLERVRQEVFESERAWALKNQRAAGRLRGVADATPIPDCWPSTFPKVRPE